MIVSILMTILLVAIIFSLGYIWYLKFFKTHTRERFAFIGLSTIASLISIFILQVYSSQGVLNAVFNTSNLWFSTNFKTYETDYRDHCIVLGVITILISFIYKIHQNWMGPISTIAAKRHRFKEENNILEEFRLQLSDFFRKSTSKRIVEYRPNEDNNKYSVFSSAEFEKSPWYEEVYELFVFRSSQYQIDLNSDYYEEENCFISKYGQNKEWIAILCSLETPNQREIEQFIKFIFSRNQKYAKIIVAIKNTFGEKYEKTLNGKSIEYRFENELLNSLVDFRFYAQYIKEQFTIKPITENNRITLKDFYVDLRAKFGDNKIIENIESYTIDWLNNDLDNKHLGILGEYGCGKSVFSLKLTHELLIKNNPERIPILIELRGKSPRNLSSLEILSTWASSFRIEPLALWKLHKAGKLLIIFEGFDEMDMVGDKEVRFSHFQKLWEFAIPKSKIIITGRPNFFLDDSELKINLGIDKPFDSSHYCVAIYLEKLDKIQIRKALRNIENDTRSQVMELLNNNSSNSNFYDLVSRPAILYLVSVIWKERRLSDIKDNINSAVVIGEFIKYSYSRQTDKKVSFPLTEHEREYFMLGVATGMHKINDLSNQLSKNDLVNIILKLYRDFPSEVLPIKNATQQTKNSLKERMKDNPTAEEMILTDVRSCGVLVNDLSRKDFFKFAHKSFFEYLVSLFFIESVIKENSTGYVMVRAITKTLEIPISNFEHSKETIAFAAEILTSRLKLDVSNEETKKITAQKLFQILYPAKYLSNFPKIVGFVEILGSHKSLFPKLSILLILMIPFFGSILYKDGPELTTKYFFINILLCFPLVCFAYFLQSHRLNRNAGTKRIQIWLNCCNQLQINEEIITKIITLKFLQFLKGEYHDPFYIYLRRVFKIKEKSENSTLNENAS